MKIVAQANVPQEVLYAGTVKGEGLVICLSDEDPTKQTRWRIEVYVQIAQGWWMLGYFTTNYPVTDGAAARVVGFASCPGAMGWKVMVQNSQDDTNVECNAELILQAGLCCGGGSPYGVFVPPVPGSGKISVDTGEGGA